MTTSNSDNRPVRPFRSSLTRAANALSRRQALVLLGSSAAVAAGCGSDDATETATGASAPAPAGASGATSSSVGWARGGTRALAASYPDPFATRSAAACTLTCRETLGPCYASTIVRRDVSEGQPGLPMRLSLLVVDESCTPIEGATIDIWHTRNSGAYSGDDTGLSLDGTPIDFSALLGAGAPDAPPPGAPPAGAGPGGFNCTGADPESESQRFFRGTQTTDAEGRVDFDTCYPGWYAGRAMHVHFIVRRNGGEYVTSQLYFPEALTEEICASHPDYAEFGQPDTTNSTDQFFGGPEHVLDAEPQADGAIVASKTIVLRSSLDDELCGSDPLVPAATPMAG
jgi:protocatechuate 3,4-dioxygenase beta subunit